MTRSIRTTSEISAEAELLKKDFEFGEETAEEILKSIDESNLLEAYLK